MNKTRILLASVLKPINDTRMYGKLGLSLAKLPGTQMHVAGYAAPVPPAPDNMHFHPIFWFKRLSISRFLAPLRFLKLLFRLKPDVVILGTHELLLISLFYKLFRPCHLVYDIRENYYLNLQSQGVYRPVTSWLLANAIRLTEWISAPFIHKYFLAESSYAHQLPFLRGNYLILENKYQPKYPEQPAPPNPQAVKVPAQNIKLLYSGTISELYGAFRAVQLCEKLNQVKPIYTLNIVGYCPQAATWEKLKSIIADKPYIQVLGGDQLVPHHQILHAIATSNVGLLPYYAHPSLSTCLPTKLYEYIAQTLPVLVQQNPLWQALTEELNAGLVIDFDQTPPATIHTKLQSTLFYGQDVAVAYWQSEEVKLFSWAQTTILPNNRISLGNS